MLNKIAYLDQDLMQNTQRGIQAGSGNNNGVCHTITKSRATREVDSIK